ncbi:MAG: hypothetical protein LAO51_04865 [Acidobacteriia bacterium]|nr:hypothetical protein [Terriglobia bacterium]
MRRMLAACVIVVAVFAAIAGSWALLAVSSTPAEAKCGICPYYCIGVTCDNGRTYCNSCLAACAGAHNCVVTGF